MNLKLVLGLTLAGLTVLFIIQNVAVVETRFLFWTLVISRSLLIFFILAFGIVPGWLLGNRSPKLHGSFYLNPGTVDRWQQP